MPAINQQLLQELTPSYGRSSLQFFWWTDGRFFSFLQRKYWTRRPDEQGRQRKRQQKQSWNKKGQVFEGSKIGLLVVSNIFDFHPEYWGRFPFWLIFFSGFETTNLWQDRLASLPYGCPAGRDTDDRKLFCIPKPLSRKGGVYMRLGEELQLM